MSDLRVALVVPTDDRTYDEKTLRSWIQAGHVDLVVFPEMFADALAFG